MELLRGGVGWGLGTLHARQGDIRREGAPPATSEDLGGHSEQFAASEFFNVEVVEEFFNIEVVDEMFVFAAIRQPGFSRLCPPPIVLQGFKTQDLSLCTYI